MNNKYYKITNNPFSPDAHHPTSLRRIERRRADMFFLWGQWESVRSTVGFALFSLVLAFLLPTSAYSLVDRGESFDSTRIPVEMQAWWAPDFGHIHAGLRLPLGQTVSGILDVDVRVVLHNNPGKLVRVKISAESNTTFEKRLNLSCPYDGKNNTVCAFNVPFSLDTSKMKDGWRELRVRAYVKTPDGLNFFNSSGIPVNVQNGKSDSNYTRYCDNTSLIGRNWYEGFEYTNAVIECVPLEPVSGQQTFRVRAQKASGHLTVGLDKTHFIPAVGPYPAQQHSSGQILFDKDGNYQSWQSINIDTTKLADGWHSLAVTSTNPGGSTSGCAYCKGALNHAAGVAKMWFYVDNGNPRGSRDDELVSDPVDEDPVIEEPVVEQQPVVEAPIDEDPIDEDPVVTDSPSPSASNNTVIHAESQGGGSSNNLKVTTSGELAGVNDDLYLAAISTRGNIAASSVTGLGLHWSRVEIQCSGRNVTGLEVWMAQGEPNHSGRVTATFSRTSANASIVASRYSNVDPERPIGSIVSGNTGGISGGCFDGTDSDRYTFALPTTSDESSVYTAASMRNKSHIPDTGFSERAEVKQGLSGGKTSSVVVQDRFVSSIATIDVRGNFSSTVDWTVIGIEIKPRSGNRPR
ncbi:MAG: hypothetical protein V3V31_02865 [Methylococcales bacterium]